MKRLGMAKKINKISAGAIRIFFIGFESSVIPYE